jgi:hypothetical protein
MQRICSWECHAWVVRKTSTDCGHEQHYGAKPVVTQVEIFSERLLKHGWV